MRGEVRHRFLVPGTSRVGEGTVQGGLVSLGRYPGLVEGRGRVRGEVYRLDRPELLPILDREEGYNFVRRQAVVSLPDGRRVRAWLYRYRGPRERATPIPAGDWRRR